MENTASRAEGGAIEKSGAPRCGASRKGGLSRHNQFERKRTFTGLVMLIPTTVFCTLFIIVPVIRVFYLSFMNWNGISTEKTFAGFSNYARLPSTEGFWEMAKGTIIYALGVTVFTIIISFILAMALDQKGRGRLNRSVMRSLWFFPCLLGLAIVGILWHIMYNYSNGLINSIIKMFGGKPVNWLETYGVTRWAIIIASVWSQIGLCIIVFLAGLQSIPTDLYEAAAIDGASPRQRRWKITVPMMAPAITINVLTTNITAFKMYELPWIVSNGMPGYSTRLLTQRIFFYAFQGMDYGIGSALSVVLIIIITIISLVQLVFLRKREDVY